jgi:iron complex transport system substrate-binding protein
MSERMSDAEAQGKNLSALPDFSASLRLAASPSASPRRIVCLTEETTETLYLLGEQERIVGISGYTARPPEARRDKPKVSAFINAKFDKIMALEPDLVLAFSDLQADIAAELIRRGLNVFTFNQRSVAEILNMILTLARIIGCEDKGRALVDKMTAELEAIRQAAAGFPRRPRVFFEEWHEPLISGIRWVDELVEIAGGECLFPHLRHCQAAKDRILNPLDVAAQDPEVVIASWCGRLVKKKWIRERAGWENVSAARENHIYEVKSTYILQPGPAALTEGVRQLHAILAHVAGVEVSPELRPQEKTDAYLSP